MKLGVSYMVFDGSELLEAAILSIRNQVDFVSVIYQSTSYFGNPAESQLELTVKRLEYSGLIDQLVHREPDLSLHHKDNELGYRNLGLQLSKEAACTHHLTLDVDEFFNESQLAYAKTQMNGYDVSIVPMSVYYKKPTYLIVPDQKLHISFIHSVENEYDRTVTFEEFPFRLETTRRLKCHAKCRIFSKEEVNMHHMAYVRKDIRRKLENSDNGQFYRKREQFYSDFNKYQLGDRLRIVPDFMNRRTVEVENRFNVRFEEW
jgi:hypothetical protein